MAAKLKTSITIRPEVLERAGVLSANETHRYSISSLIEELIQDAYAKRADTFKRIEAVRDAKNKQIGWVAFYGDHRVGEFDLLDKQGAILALDAYVYEELSK